MKFRWIIYTLVVLLLTLSGCGGDSLGQEKIENNSSKLENAKIDVKTEAKTEDKIDMQMSLTSTAFEHKKTIPAKYTCKGSGISPELSWANAPKETKSFVLIMDDPDAVGGVWDHWIVYDIPANINSIKEGGALPDGAKVAKSTNGQKAYVGPCPPKGSGLHNYTFKLYALGVEEINHNGESRVDIEHAMHGHVLEEITLIGTLENKKKFLLF